LYIKVGKHNYTALVVNEPSDMFSIPLLHSNIGKSALIVVCVVNAFIVVFDTLLKVGADIQIKRKEL